MNLRFEKGRVANDRILILILFFPCPSHYLHPISKETFEYLSSGPLSRRGQWRTTPNLPLTGPMRLNSTLDTTEGRRTMDPSLVDSGERGSRSRGRERSFSCSAHGIFRSKDSFYLLELVRHQ